MKICLSIAGFDNSGGAGLQADLKTFAATGTYGTCVLTALPIQNTQGVTAQYGIPLDAITAQLKTLFTDIKPNTIKIGMLYSAPIIELVSDFLHANAKSIPIILDPVMIATSGDRLLQESAIEALKKQLIPMATLITPNLPEAKFLTNHYDNIETMSKNLIDLGANAVLLKGGHQDNDRCDDFFHDSDNNTFWLHAKRIQTQNTHGTGCTLSSAIASFVAQGDDILTACKKAKAYLSQAILNAKSLVIGKGRGPVHHFYFLDSDPALQPKP